MNEIHVIIRMTHDMRQPTRVNIDRVKVLCRGGVVLLNSHIEGYIKALGELAIYRIGEKALPKSSLSGKFRYHLSRELIDNIRNTNDPENIASRIDHFLNQHSFIWDLNADFVHPLPVDNFVDSWSTPYHRNIRSFFNRFGYDSFHRDLARNLKRDFQICTNMVD